MIKINTMYHLSDTKNRESILKNGLLTDFDLTGFSAIYLSDTLSYKDKSSSFDIWMVNVEGVILEPDFTGDPDIGSWFICFDNIEKYRIKLM